MNQFPLQFIDFIIVEILATIPLCWLILSRISGKVIFPVGVLCLLVVTGSLLAWKDSWEIFGQSFGGIEVARQLFVITPIMLGLTVLVVTPLLRKYRVGESSLSKQNFYLQLIIILSSLMLPSLYQSHRIHESIARLTQIETESRMGEFTALGRDLVWMRPQIEFNDQPLIDLISRVEKQEQQLRAAANQMSNGHDKAKLLAILGERAEAIKVLEPLINSGSATIPDYLLLATIYEHNQDWVIASGWYGKAKKLIEQSPQEQPSLLMAALKGIGFTNRKRGENDKAEAAYLQLLKLNPSPDSHFLLAQFYQDAQVGERAGFHLDKALYLGGNRYREKAKEMKFRLRSYQFGCFRIR